jgi:two-component system sensor histidine kinase YesM
MKMFIEKLKKLYSKALINISRIKLRNRLMVFFTLILIIPISVIVFTTLKYSREIIQNEAGILVSNTVSQVSMSIDEMLQGNIVNVANFLLHDQRIHEILTRNYDGDTRDTEHQVMLDELTLSNKILLQYTATYNGIYIAALYGKNGKIYSVSFQKQNESILRQEIEKIENELKNDIYSGKVRFLSRQVNIFSSARFKSIWDENVILAASKIFDYSTTQYKGLCIYTISEKVLSDKYKNIRIGRTGKVFVIDNKGQIISSMDEKLLKTANIDKKYIEKALDNNNGSFELTENGRTLLGYTHTSYLTGWTTVAVVPVNELNEKMTKVTLVVFVITLLAIISALTAAVFISRTITKPVYTVIESMEKFREGDFNTRIAATGYYEISKLAEFFNIMVEEIQQHILTEYELEKKKKEAELYVLQAQINPHFLYNTLESIIWKAKVLGADEICYMASAMGRLFRLAVNKSGPIVKVKEEIEHVKAYMDIQNMRYGGRLELIINVDDESILDYSTLKLILQPVVENAIYHGFEKTGKKGLIVIEAFISENNLVFNVTDNGVGIASEVLQKVNGRIMVGNNEGSQDKRGIGLVNIHERIELYFGKGYGIIVSSIDGEGTSVRITTPIII